MRHHLVLAILLAGSLSPAMCASDPQERPATVPPTAMLDADQLPIDLPTALRLVESVNPSVAIARYRVEHAIARQRQSEVLWLPSLTAGANYQRHDGQIQDTSGGVFTTSRQSLFAGAAAVGRVTVADALFLPLVTRQLTRAETAAARATANNVQLDVALSYLDLLQVHAAIAINAATLALDLEMLRRAEAAERAGLNKSPSDVPRAQTEYNLRRQEGIDAQGRAALVSARLAQLLLLQPTVDLVPVDSAVLPIMLVPETPLGDLVALAANYRPELASVRAISAAEHERLRQAQIGPFIPNLEATYSGGTFGGGRNGDMVNFNGRGDATAAAVWEFRNLGLGSLYYAQERRSLANIADVHIREVQAQVAAEVTAAAKVSRTRLATFVSAQDAVRHALEMYRRLEASSFGMAGPRAQYDALEPLLAIQALNQARLQYLTEVIEYNRAQFRLYTALGQPPLCALPGTAMPIEPPVLPAAA